MRWAGVACGVAVLILVPFVVFGDALDSWALGRVGSEGAVPDAAWVVALLAGDILLPVPSSFVSTAAGIRLGAAGGFGASWVGMTLGCLLGYLIGFRGGRAGLARWVGADQLARFDALQSRYGTAAVVLTRAVPVLAEASVLAAGAARMSLATFLPAVVAANAGISAVYAGAGAASASWGTFVWALTGAVGVPAVAYGVVALASRLGIGTRTRTTS